MIVLFGFCSAGRRLLTMQLQFNSWTFSSSFPPHIVQAFPQHSLWTMPHYSQYTLHRSTFRPAQQLPRSVIGPPACSPRLLGSQSLSVHLAYRHRAHESPTAAGDVSNHQSTNAATARPTWQLYTSPAAHRRSRQTSSSCFAAQPGQSVSSSQYAAALSTVPPQQQQQQQHDQQHLGIQAQPSSTLGRSNHPSNSSFNHSKRSSKSRSSSSSLRPAQYRAQISASSCSSSISPAQYRAQLRASGSSSSLSPAQYRAQSRTSSCSSSSTSLAPHRAQSRISSCSSSSLSPAQYRAQSRTSSCSSSLSPAQYRAHSRSGSCSGGSSSSSSSLPLPDSSNCSSSTSFSNHASAEASGNSYSGSSNRHIVAMSNLVPQQQQQQLLGIHAPTSSSWGGPGSHSNSTTLHQHKQRSTRSRSSSSSLSPAEYRAQSRTSSTLPLPEISSSSTSSSSTYYGDAAAGASSMILQQRLQEVIRFPRRQRTRSISVSQSPSMQQQQQREQQQQQQQSVQGSSSESRYWSSYQPQPVPPELLQPPPTGPLHLDVTAMLSWNDGSPPGLEKFVSRKLPVHLDHTTLLWVSVYQPEGPGTSAAIWVGKTWLTTLDSSRSDQAGSDHARSDPAGSDWQQQTLDRSLPDQISNAARGGILLNADLISSGLEAADVADQQQPLPAPMQQQQETESEEEDISEDAEVSERLEDVQQQQRRRQRQQQLQPPVPPVKQQQSAAANRLWLDVQQRPDVGLAPAAVVEGLTFARHNRTSPDSSSSSSNEGSDPEDSLAFNEELEARVGSASAVVAASSFACNDPRQQTDAGVAGHNPWYDYLLLVSGDFSVVDNENMFPNVLVHCSDGRVLHNARSATDVAAFVAEADEDKMQAHIVNLLGYAWNQPNNYGTEWVVNRVRDRWGEEAMVRFGVDWLYLNARLSAKGGR